MAKLDKRLERLNRRAAFVQKYINSSSQKGVKVSHSVGVLSENVLFICERAIYKDLKKDLSSQKY